jgi:methylmalonyl-CoA/ethylmalonyl-CoA epimerase
MKSSMRINHIGYAVQDLNAAVSSFLKLGYRVCRTEVEDHARNVRICFLQDPGGMKVELIAPLNETSPVSVWLQKNGSSPYHICYESEDLISDIATLRRSGFILVEPPLSAPAMDCRQAAFLYGKNTGLIELVENDKK